MNRTSGALLSKIQNPASTLVAQQRTSQLCTGSDLSKPIDGLLPYLGMGINFPSPKEPQLLPSVLRLQLSTFVATAPLDARQLRIGLPIGKIWADSHELPCPFSCLKTRSIYTSALLISHPCRTRLYMRLAGCSKSCSDPGYWDSYAWKRKQIVNSLVQVRLTTLGGVDTGIPHLLNELRTGAGVGDA